MALTHSSAWLLSSLGPQIKPPTGFDNLSSHIGLLFCYYCDLLEEGRMGNWSRSSESAGFLPI